MREIDGTASPLAFFGAELRRFRVEAGLSQEQLGQRIGYSGTMIGKIETGERATSERIAERCDEALATKGLLIRIYDLARRWDSGSPSWFAGWKDRERTATVLCWWEPLLVAGLVQTADYARALYDQLMHLVKISNRSKATIQVVPGSVGAHVGLLGAFAVATGNGADTVYMESPDEGQTTELPSVVAKLTETFNILRGEALSRTASRELIMKVAEEQWT